MRLPTAIINAKSRKLRVDEVFYHMGKGILIPFLLIGFWFAHGGFEQYGEVFGCVFREISGLPCPGCGGTRALYYLFCGRWAESFWFHPAVLYGVCAYLHFMSLCFYRRHMARTWEQKEIRFEWYLYLAVAVILIQWIIKIILMNYLQVPYI